MILHLKCSRSWRVQNDRRDRRPGPPSISYLFGEVTVGTPTTVEGREGPQDPTLDGLGDPDLTPEGRSGALSLVFIIVESKLFVNATQT